MIYKTPEEVKAKVEGLVVEILEVHNGPVQPGSRFEIDVGSSLEIVEVVMACEEEFDLEIPNEDAEKCPTVGDLTLYIQRKLGLTVNA